MKIEKLLICVMLFFVSCPLWACASGASPVELKVSHDGTGQSDLDINFTMIYHGSKPIEIYESDLPWGAVSMQVFMNNGRHTEVQRLGYINDPGPDKLTLLPDHVYRSKVNLAAIFRDIGSLLKKNSITVEWSYTLTPIHGNPFPTVSGSFVIDRQP